MFCRMFVLSLQISWEGILESRRRVSGIRITWAYAPSQVRFHDSPGQPDSSSGNECLYLQVSVAVSNDGLRYDVAIPWKKLGRTDG